MIKRTEGYFTGDLHKLESSSQNQELFFQSWTSAKARATLVLTHGISEHSESYHEMALELVPRGWDIYAWDLRGHGRSEGKRGYIDDFHRYSRDLHHFVKHLKSGSLKNSKLPLIMMGHSMGGLITLRYLVDQGVAAPAKGLVLSSPALGISIPIPTWKEFAARALLNYLPQVTLPNDIPHNLLTHIEERWRRYDSDPLRHDKVSAAMYFGMIEGFEKVHNAAAQIRIPTLIVAAGDERVVSRPAIEDFFPKLGAERKKLIIYEKSYHEVVNDVEREQVFNDIDLFLGSVVAANGGGAT